MTSSGVILKKSHNIRRNITDVARNILMLEIKYIINNKIISITKFVVNTLLKTIAVMIKKIAVKKTHQ